MRQVAHGALIRLESLGPVVRPRPFGAGADGGRDEAGGVVPFQGGGEFGAEGIPVRIRLFSGVVGL